MQIGGTSEMRCNGVEGTQLNVYATAAVVAAASAVFTSVGSGAGAAAAVSVAVAVTRAVVVPFVAGGAEALASAF